MACEICQNKVYRLNLCKICYINSKKNTFHCTHHKCISPVFAMTLCQKHYRMWKSSCLFCNKNIYCKSVCRSHYMKYLNGELKIQEPSCLHCKNKVYVDHICLKHFKDKYSQCIITGCNNKNHKRGLCCAHYFYMRRRNLI